jgi:5-methyltetrahydropteroyltriglutamate--homocysteine methyltransferase
MVDLTSDDLTRAVERHCELFNECVRDRPAGMTIGVHLCRGNLKGAWMAEGGYEPVADALCNRLDASTYCLEYDTERAGDFSPLRLVPRGKRVILGLVSTKTPVLESKEALKRRIDAAAKHVPLEQLGIGPQCGFSSGGGGGQALTQDDTRKKLELIVETAREVWGDI